MDELLQEFISSTYIEEMAIQINRSISLFDFYEHTMASQSLIDVIDELSISDDLHSKFLINVNEGLDYILRMHGVSTVDTTNLYIKNEILTAIGKLQHTEDLSVIDRILDNTESKEEQFSSIVELLSSLEQTEVLMSVLTLDSIFLINLKNYINTKTSSDQELPSESIKSLVDNYKLFIDIAGADTLGQLIVKNGVTMGLPFKTYIPYVKDELFNTQEEKESIDFVSILFLSSDGYKDPLAVFRENIDSFTDKIDITAKTEVVLLNIMSKITSARKENNE